MKKNFFRNVLIIGILGLFAQGRPVVHGHIAHPLPSTQLIVVVAKDWNTVGARLYAFEKQKGSWQLRFSFPAVVGQKGMAMGEGMLSIKIPDAPQKIEGDLKSPAGIFNLGPAFGYAAKNEAIWIHLPYVCATDTLVCTINWSGQI
jgi:L,D-peptidoglycan transpeptidase YkuD (ErfK/YbiS/YcfS/YnhG family)